MERASGVLMHISSLYGDFSIGSFGKEAKAFIDVISNAGFSWWQVLPFCPVDDCNFPYKSQGAFWGNPYFVDLEILCRKGLHVERNRDIIIQCVNLFGVIIFINAINNLIRMENLFLEKVPSDLSVKEITDNISEINRVSNIHHICVWSIEGHNFIN